jgi:hypothetical protein
MLALGIIKSYFVLPKNFPNMTMFTHMVLR